MLKVTIRVVTTMATDKFHNCFQNVVDYAVEGVLSITEGVTVDASSKGYWKDSEGKVISELGHNIWTLCEGRDIPALETVAKYLKQLGEQDCVLFTVEEVKGVTFI